MSQESYGWPQMAAQPPSAAETQREVQAALAARRELGPDYDDHIAAGLADRVEQLAAVRLAELRHRGEQGSAVDRAEATSRSQQFVLGIISIGAGIPITAIAATNITPGLLGVIVSWAGIVGVNAVFSLGRRFGRSH